MKKLFFFLAALMAFAGTASAQYFSPLDVLPSKEGTRMVNKTYDAAGNLLGTTTFTIESVYDNQSNQKMNMGYVMTDASGYTVDTGSILADYDENGFYMKMEASPVFPDAVEYLSAGTKLMGDFLDYPDLFENEYPVTDNFPEGNIFNLTGGELDVRSTGENTGRYNLNVRNRTYEGTEDIMTPAGNFDAYKIRFEVEVYDKDSEARETFKGVEWFAAGTGIVRTEIYDENNNLQNYTILTNIME